MIVNSLHIVSAGLPRVVSATWHAEDRGLEWGGGDHVTAAREAITMLSRVVLPARHGATGHTREVTGRLGRQEGPMS